MSLELEQARDAWLASAADEDQLADHYDAHGQPYGCTKSYRVRAEMYRRTAQALQIEIDTGVAVCSCCHKPFGEGTRILIGANRSTGAS